MRKILVLIIFATIMFSLFAGDLAIFKKDHILDEFGDLSAESYVVTANDLSGSLTCNGKKSSILYSIVASPESICFEIKEKAVAINLSTMDYGDEYIIKVKDESGKVYTTYGYLAQNNDAINNVICSNDSQLWQLFLDEDNLKITISNRYGRYLLGKIDFSGFDELVFNKEPYIATERLIDNQEYEEALVLLDNYLETDYTSYCWYDADELRTKANEGVYNEAYRLYGQNLYEDAIAKLNSCSGYKKAELLIEEISEVLRNLKKQKNLYNEYKMGIGIVYTDNHTEKQATYDCLVAVVVTDSAGKIVSCQIDGTLNKMKTTEIDNTKIFKSKCELGYGYNMVKYSEATNEWFQQVDAFEQYVIGKTADEVAAIQTRKRGSEEPHPGYVVAADETLFASCSIQITDLIDVVVNACNDSSCITFIPKQFYELELKLNSSAKESQEPTKKTEGFIKIYVEIRATVVGFDKSIIARKTASVRPVFTVDTCGYITHALPAHEIIHMESNFSTGSVDFVQQTSDANRVATVGSLEGLSFDTPFFITSFGQSTDAAMLDTVMKNINKSKAVDYVYNSTATADALKGYKTVVIAVGASTKGLDAAGISEAEETARATEIINYLKANPEVKVICCHIGGSARRGTLSDVYADMVMEIADLIVLKEDANFDYKFTTYAQEHNIPISLVYATKDTITVFKGIF